MPSSIRNLCNDTISDNCPFAGLVQVLPSDLGIHSFLPSEAAFYFPMIPNFDSLHGTLLTSSFLCCMLGWQSFWSQTFLNRYTCEAGQIWLNYGLAWRVVIQAAACSPCLPKLDATSQSVVCVVYLAVLLGSREWDKQHAKHMFQTLL